MATLRAGAARADMTPPVGIQLCGYWKPRPAEGIETPLNAHALVLDDGETRLAIVALDLIALVAADADAAKARIQTATGIPPENVLIACSHTHEAPYPVGLLGKHVIPDAAYMGRVKDAIVGSVTLAAGSMAPAEVGFAASDVPDFCQNRRRYKEGRDVFNAWMLPRAEVANYPPAGPTDDAVTLLAVRTAERAPLALLWNYTLHAHSFSTNRVCADYPYYVWQSVARELGGDFVSVYTAGACGDINRIASTDPKEMVSSISAAVTAMWRSMAFRGDVRLGAQMRRMDAPFRDFTEFQEEEIRRKLPGALEVCRGEWELMRAEGITSVNTTVHAMSIGDFALAGVPGEYFCALGLDIKQRSPFSLTAVVELADDYVGYIPTAAAFDEGGYELFTVRSSKVARGVGEAMADAAVAMLGGMR